VSGKWAKGAMFQRTLRRNQVYNDYYIFQITTIVEPGAERSAGPLCQAEAAEEVRAVTASKFGEAGRAKVTKCSILNTIKSQVKFRHWIERHRQQAWANEDAVAKLPKRRDLTARERCL